jgi:hypothetical protein
MVINTIEFRLMRQLRSASTMPALCKLASLDAVVVLTWRKVSPSAWLMVDPRNGARAVIRDTRSDAARFLWSALAAGEMDPMSEGRTAGRGTSACRRSGQPARPDAIDRSAGDGAAVTAARSAVRTSAPSSERFRRKCRARAPRGDPRRLGS